MSSLPCLFPLSLVRQPLEEPPPPLLYSLQLCSAPLYGSVPSRPITEFLDYHRHVIGMDHAVIYDAGGVTSAIMTAFKDRGFLESGLVEVTDFREAYSYDVWYNGQVGGGEGGKGGGGEVCMSVHWCIG